MKPMLASDFEEGRAQFPLFAQPKVDGVRAMNMTGTLTGRSLKKFKNKFVTKLLSHSEAIANLNTLNSIDAHHRMGNVSIKPIKDRFTQTHRHIFSKNLKLGTAAGTLFAQ